MHKSSSEPNATESERVYLRQTCSAASQSHRWTHAQTHTWRPEGRFHFSSSSRVNMAKTAQHGFCLDGKDIPGKHSEDLICCYQCPKVKGRSKLSCIRLQNKWKISKRQPPPQQFWQQFICNSEYVVYDSHETFLRTRIIIQTKQTHGWSNCQSIFMFYNPILIFKIQMSHYTKIYNITVKIPWYYHVCWITLPFKSWGQ